VVSLVRYNLLHVHLLSCMTVHHLHHLHYHHFHLLSLVQSFILNLRLASLANPFHHIDLFFTYRLDSTDSPTICRFCSGFVCMVYQTEPVLSRFSNALKIYMHFRFISFRKREDTNKPSMILAGDSGGSQNMTAVRHESRTQGSMMV